MPSDPDRVDRWRQLAAEALNAAGGLTDPEARKAMLEIADAYEFLAQRLEERTASAAPAKMTWHS
jgi:hypothetical protein